MTYNWLNFSDDYTFSKITLDSTRHNTISLEEIPARKLIWEESKERGKIIGDFSGLKG